MADTKEKKKQSMKSGVNRLGEEKKHRRDKTRVGKEKARI